MDEETKLEQVLISDLKPHPKNPRVHPDSAIDKLVKSMKQYGFTNPVLISKDNVILAGHARTKAARKAGKDKVPVIRLDLEGAAADAYLIADNRLQQDTKWEKNVLKVLMEELEIQDYDLDLTGFDQDEIDKLLEKDEAAEEAPEMEFTPELMEEHNYIVLYFDNELDWQVAKEKYGIKTMKAKWSPKADRTGIGRVVRGSDFLD